MRVIMCVRVKYMPVYAHVVSCACVYRGQDQFCVSSAVASHFVLRPGLSLKLEPTCSTRLAG